MALNKIQRSVAGRRVILAQTLWGWCKKPVIPIAEELDLDLEVIDFIVPGIKPITKTMEAQSNSIEEYIKLGIRFQEEKNPSISEIEGYHLRLLLEILEVTLIDLPTINCKWKFHIPYLKTREIVTRLVNYVDEALDKKHWDELENAIYYILNVIWDTESKLDGKDIFWHKGVAYDTHDDWKEAVRKALIANQKEK